MTVPGLALFYGGMVRKRNILAIMAQSFGLCALITVIWIVAGYSLAFGTGNAVIGDLSRLFLSGMGWTGAFTLAEGTASAVPMTVPEPVFMFYQMTFAIITPAVVTGAFADRMRFSALLVLMSLWSLFVYAPIAHWAWAPLGWLNALGMADFSGGTVVEVNSGVAGLVCALVLGSRVGYGRDNMAPYNLAYAVTGASLLWVGWLGFNAGSAGSAGGRAAMAMVATQAAAAAATLAWLGLEWWRAGKPTVLGAISGAVAGLVAITPASGFVLPGAALVVGLVAGAACYCVVTEVKPWLSYDDSLDAFGVHGVGGAVGMLLTGVLAHGALSATPELPQGAYIGGAGLLGVQALGVVAAAGWSGAGTWVLLKIVDATIGLRVSEEDERRGLDEVLHGESLG
jgi:Amt family ammonium transporter